MGLVPFSIIGHCFYSHFIYDDMYSEPQICHSPVSWGINMTRTRYLSLHSSLMVMWRVEPVLSEGSGGSAVRVLPGAWASEGMSLPHDTKKGAMPNRHSTPI